MQFLCLCLEPHFCMYNSVCKYGMRFGDVTVVLLTILAGEKTVLKDLQCKDLLPALATFVCSPPNFCLSSNTTGGMPTGPTKKQILFGSSETGKNLLRVKPATKHRLAALNETSICACLTTH